MELAGRDLVDGGIMISQQLSARPHFPPHDLHSPKLSQLPMRLNLPLYLILSDLQHNGKIKLLLYFTIYM